MAKNLIPEIARMLGVEIGEEFKVEGVADKTYKFIIDELIVCGEKNANHGYVSANMMLVSLAKGDIEIVKLPWKPKKGDVYFTFVLMDDKWGVGSLHWDGFPNEYALLDKGWVYRTRAEAQAALPAVAAEMGVEININRALTAVEKAWLEGIVSLVLLEEELKELQEQRKGAAK